VSRFIATHAINSFKMNPHFPINTIMIMRGAIVAQQDGVLDRYIEAILTEMWEEGANLGDADVVVAALTKHGFDGTAMIVRTQDQAVKDRLVANTEAAVARGAFGIPTFFVGDEMFFGKERLGQVKAALSKVSSLVTSR
jgi:2-hydroxychromene-2-carboxylate isomerase